MLVSLEQIACLEAWLGIPGLTPLTADPGHMTAHALLALHAPHAMPQLRTKCDSGCQRAVWLRISHFCAQMSRPELVQAADQAPTDDQQVQLEQLVVEMDDMVERLRSKVAWLDMVRSHVYILSALLWYQMHRSTCLAR